MAPRFSAASPSCRRRDGGSAISAIRRVLAPGHHRPRLPPKVPEAGDFRISTRTPTSKSLAPARSISLGRGKPHGELLKEAVRGAVPVPGWVGIISLDRAAGPEPEDVNVDRDILWETPLRMDRAALEASRNPSLPPAPCRATPGSRARPESSGAAPVPCPGCGDRPEASGVHELLAQGEGRTLTRPCDARSRLCFRRTLAHQVSERSLERPYR